MLNQTDAAELRVARMLSMWAVMAHTAGQLPPLMAWADLPVSRACHCRLLCLACMLDVSPA